MKGVKADGSRITSSAFICNPLYKALSAIYGRTESRDIKLLLLPVVAEPTLA